jgi:MFS family permease
VQGYFALASIYLAFSLSASFADQIVARIGTKVALTVCPQFYALFIFCVGFSYFTESTAAHYLLMVPTGIALGLVASTLWTAQGVFLTYKANQYADANAQQSSAALGLFNGIFFAAIQGAGIIANFAASLLIKTAHLSYSTLYLGMGVMCSLGATVFCWLPNVTSDEVAHSHKQLGDSDHADSSPAESKSVWSFLTGPHRSTILPLLPLMMAQGMFQGFTWGLFPDKVISAALGKDNVGYVTAAFAFADMCGSLGFGKLSDRVGRVPLLAAGIVFNTLTCTLLFAYRASIPSFATFVVFCFGISFGLIDAILNVNIPALLAAYFPSSTASAFSVYKLLQSTGTLFNLFLSPLLSFEVNIVVVAVYLLVAMFSLIRLHRSLEEQYVMFLFVSWLVFLAVLFELNSIEQRVQPAGFGRKQVVRSDRRCLFVMNYVSDAPLFSP